MPFLKKFKSGHLAIATKAKRNNYYWAEAAADSSCRCTSASS